MDVTVLGSGTLLPHRSRGSAAHLVEADRASVLLDCGAGALHGLAREGRDWRRISHVVISHFHVDHVGDLAALLWAWKHGTGREAAPSRTLIGPPGTASLLAGLARAHGEWVLAPDGELRVVEVERSGRWEDRECALELAFHPTPHTPESVGIRVETTGRSVGYTGDTGPSSELGRFFRGTDLLIAECSLPDHLATDNHLSPSTVASLAVEADPEVLVLTHFYPQLDPASLPDLLRARGYTGTVHAGHDGLRIRIPGS